MPTSCWNTDRPMPVQTIGSRPNRPPSRSRKRGRWSEAISARISPIRASVSVAGPSTSVSTLRASVRRPAEIRKRGDSGIIEDITK